MIDTSIDLQLYGIYDHADQELVMRFLSARGIDTPQKVEQIFNPSSEDEHDIMQAKDAQLWMAKLYDFRNTKIVVVGDYDADGVMASTVAMKALQAMGLGSKLYQYVPIREDGYGLSKVSVDKILTQFPDAETLLTVDNGIVAYEGVEYAKSKGLNVLVSDHHLAKDEATIADAVVDINQPGDNYAFKGLSGTAVIWKLLHSFAKVATTPAVAAQVGNLVDYAGISTMTDIMPVLDENRYFVKRALQSLNMRSRLQWSALFDLLRDKNKLYGDAVNEEFIGFTLGPMINAAGRVTGSPELAYRFFMSEDIVELRQLALQLFEINERRKTEVKEFSEMAADSYAGQLPDAIMTALPLKVGYAGLVASELSQKYDRPAVVMSGTSGTLHGSARSPIWFNIVEAFQQLYDAGLIVQFGGHAGAAGLEILAENVKPAERMLSELVAETLSNMTQSDRDRINAFTPDLELHLEENFAKEARVATDLGFAGTDDLIQVSTLLDKLRPFGQNFEAPIIKVENVDFHDAYRMGSEKQHAKVNFGGLSVIAWNAPDIQTTRTVTGQISINEFRGNLSPQLIVNRFVN